VGRVGLEPTTYGLKVRYSAIELAPLAAKRSQLDALMRNGFAPRDTAALFQRSYTGRSRRRAVRIVQSFRRRDLDVLAVIAAGGTAGALARYGLAVAIAHDGTAFPWATFLTNISGCLVMGLLMFLVTEVWPPRRYARPFLGVGVLGGFTTFSTFATDTRGLLAGGAAGTAFVYVVASLLGGLIAVRLGFWCGAALAGLAGHRGPDRRAKRPDSDEHAVRQEV
jgi:CrcB protein